MVNWKSKKLGDLLVLGNGLAMLLLINVLSSFVFFRIDLTDEKRYSIKPATRAILQNLDDDVYIEVYLSGELNASFQRFQKSIRETLEEFRIYSDNKVQYTFADPGSAMGEKAQREFMAELASKGIQPTRVFDKKEGQRIEKIIFPGAVISYGGAETGVMLLKGNKAGSPEEEINQSVEGIEFELANAIYKLANDSPKRIGLVSGHGELEGNEAAALRSSLTEVYDAGEVSLLSGGLYDYDALIIAKPITAFSVQEKYRLDQYIMHRGNVLFLIDKLEAHMDSASRADYYAFPYNLDLDDMLFRYGVRLNMEMVQDRVSGRYPVITGETGGKPKIQLIDWPFFPLINRYADHPVTHNLDAVMLRFAGTIDTVKAAGIRKTPLLFSSQYARAMAAPVLVSIQSLRNDINADRFKQSYIPVAYLLEGKFTSLFKNRFVPEGENPKVFREISRPAKLMVVADGDLAKNVVNPRTGEPQPLGFDPVSNYTFANKDLVMNMLAFLTDENGLISARNKDVRIRPLDRERVNTERTKWQFINIAVPLLLLFVFGSVRTVLRKRRYGL
jgi:ABC-2 type transport system permease protein